jgi:hypothetical protein
LWITRGQPWGYPRPPTSPESILAKCYQCLICEVMWPVLTYPARQTAATAGATRNPAA